MKVLITGGSGYLAWELVRQLKEKNEVDIIVATSDIRGLLSDSNYMGVDLIQNNDIWSNDCLISSIDIIIHTAFCRQSIGSKLMESLWFSKKLFLRAKECSVKAVINVSSQSIYGSSKEILPDESADFAPRYMYALAKGSTEVLVEAILAEKSSRTVFTNVRLASLVGPSKNVPVNVLYRFVESALNNNDIKIQGGKQNFSFLDVRDAAEAINSLLKIPFDRWEKVYNLGPEKQVNIMKLAKIAVEYAVSLGKDCVSIYVEEDDDIVLNAGMCSEKLYQTINWRPKFSIHNTVEATGKYIQSSKYNSSNILEFYN